MRQVGDGFEIFPAASSASADKEIVMKENPMTKQKERGGKTRRPTVKKEFSGGAATSSQSPVYADTFPLSHRDVPVPGVNPMVKQNSLASTSPGVGDTFPASPSGDVEETVNPLIASWTRYKDTKSGHFYWANKVTGVVTWDNPEDKGA